jgi:hypothetical protein
MTTRGIKFHGIGTNSDSCLHIEIAKDFFFEFARKKRSAKPRGNRLCTRMSIKKQLQTPRFQSFHDIAALRGDGLRPEFLRLFERLARGADAKLSEMVEAPKGCGFATGFTSQNSATNREALKKS